MAREDGQFKPGNPGGGRKKLPEPVREMLEAKTEHAAERLIEALDAERAVVVPGGRDVPSSIEMVPDYDMRLKASSALFDRLYGKPSQAITGEDVGPRKVDASAGLLEALKRMEGGNG